MDRVRLRAGHRGWRIAVLEVLVRFKAGRDDDLTSHTAAVIDARTMLWEIAKEVEHLSFGSQQLQTLGHRLMEKELQAPGAVYRG